MSRPRFALVVLLFAPVWAGAQGALGLRTANLTPASVSRLHLANDQGVEVVAVTPGGPAAQAGLRVEDVVTTFRAVPVVSVLQLDRLVEETPPDRTVPVGFLRDGKASQAEIHIATPLQPHSLGRVPGFTLPRVRPHRALPTSLPPASWGLTAEDVSGALVRSVAAGSPAARAGIQPGDLITHWQGTNPAQVTLLRAGQTLHVQVAVPGGIL